LRGGTVDPGSGPDGYLGVQSQVDADPFYYRPDLDAPRHPGLLRASARPFASRGLGVPVYPVLGDHDALVAGEIVPSDVTRGLAIGDRALWDLPPGLSLPPGARASSIASPDGPPDPGLIDTLLRRALDGPTVRVPPDPARRELSFDEVIGRLRTTIGGGAARPAGARLDYTADAGPRLLVIVLDLVRRNGGSGGLVTADQPSWLERELAGAGDRWVIVVSHQPLETSAGGDRLLAVLDRSRA
jgi:hypothetical protein